MLFDGSRTSFESSMNYSLNEYVTDVVYSIQEICQAEEVPEPNIVSESGRAVVASSAPHRRLRRDPALATHRADLDRARRGRPRA